MTYEHWKQNYGSQFSAADAELLAMAAQKAHDQAAAGKLWWKTATREEQRAELLRSLLACRCGKGKRHNPNACNSCGPINAALQMLAEGKV